MSTKGARRRPVVHLQPRIAKAVEMERRRRERLAGCPLSIQAVITALVEERLQILKLERGGE